MPKDKNGSSDFLAVDLDGTLLRSDMLFETFWAALGSDWRTPFGAAAALAGGRAALKQHLARSTEIDVTALPYNATVIEYVRDWRARGGRAALVTASDQSLADSIAAHLDIFDEAHGSDGARNLKGPHKAAFLQERFGAGNFTYMGDAAADFPVWKQAGGVVTMNAPGALRRKLEGLGRPAEHLEDSPPRASAYLRAMRPHQWLKNILVFLPMLAAHQLSGPTLLQSLAAFVVFSLIASSVYVLNDLLDLKSDRAHPRKRLRPFAAGEVPLAHGTWMAAGLIVAGTLLAIPLGGAFLLTMLAYFVITTAYSLGLKRRAVVDICTLAGLYTMRIIAGGTATGIPLSIWLLAFSIFFFLSLAAVKRQAELVDGAARGRLNASGRGYDVDDLPMISMMAIASGYVSVLVMALYMNSPDVANLYSRPIVLGGICCVLLYWISRMVMMTHRGQMYDDPIVFAVRDRVSRICVLMMAGFAVGGALL